MRMPTTDRFGNLRCWLLACMLCLAVPPSYVAACTVCSVAGLATLSDLYVTSRSAIVVEWVRGQQTVPDAESDIPLAQSVYRIVEVVKGPDHLRKGQLVTLNIASPTAAHDRYLLMGADAGDSPEIEWSAPLQLNDTLRKYLLGAPSRETPPQARLSYYLQHLESPESRIADDAFTELGLAPFAEVEQLKGQLARERIWNWISNPATPGSRLGLYGVLIGLCGTEDDAERLKTWILSSSTEFRLGGDGMMAGYLLLTRERGLEVLDREILANRKAPFHDVFAAQQAARFMWTNAPGTIAPQRLQQSIRQLLDHPDLRDLAIADLARWKDWSIQEQLAEIYTANPDLPLAVRRAIIRYLIVSTKDVAASEAAGSQAASPTAPQSAVPQHVVRGLRLLNALRTRDPKTVADAERFFIAP